MAFTPPMCAVHTAEIRSDRGATVLGEVEGIFDVGWQRVRDDISKAHVSVVPSMCCELMGEIGTVKHELHIYRSGVPVWQGIITRIDYEYDRIDIHAEDILWVAKRRALEKGYNYLYPPSGPGPSTGNAHFNWLLTDQCFYKWGDYWNMAGHLHNEQGPDDPILSRTINAWSMTVWEDLDYCAQYFGMDYTVVNRDIYWFDTHLAWHTTMPLLPSYLSKHPRVVEYGNRFASRYMKTDGSGYAGIANAETSIILDYWLVDVVANEVAQADRPDSTIPGVTSVPTQKELESWQKTAQDRVYDMSPPKQSVVVPSGTTLLPNAPQYDWHGNYSGGWDPNTLMPGTWFVADVEFSCASAREWHKLTEVKVRETGSGGEEVAISTLSAPTKRVVR